MTQTEPQPDSRRTSRYRSKQDAIISAAAEMLNARGVRGFTLADVAQKVGLTTPSVAYYFKKKDDLAAAALLEGIGRYKEVADGAHDAPDPSARLLLFLDRHAAMRARIRAGETPEIASFGEIRALGSPQREVVIAAYNEMFRAVRRLLDDEHGPRIDPRARTARARLMLEMAYWSIGYMRFYEPEEFPRFTARLHDLMIHGLYGKGSAWARVDAPAIGLGDPDSARETFFIAATQLINEQGYRGASVEKISARLNVTKGSFYHYNDAKDDLVVACFERSKAVMREALRVGAGQNLSGWDRLTLAAAALLKYQSSEHGPLLRVAALGALPLLQRYELSLEFERVADRFAALISEGIADGSIRPLDPMLASQMFLAMINTSGHLGAWLHDLHPDETPDIYARPLFMGLFA